MEVAVSDLKTRHYISVVENKDHNLILGQTFLHAVKFCQDNKPDRIYGIITHPQIKDLAVFCVLLSQNPVNWSQTSYFSTLF